jgi:hypothetical protein
MNKRQLIIAHLFYFRTVSTHGEFGFPLETSPARNMWGERTRQEHAGQELPFQNRKGSKKVFMWSFVPVFGTKLHRRGKHTIFIRCAAKFRKICTALKYQ